MEHRQKRPMTRVVIASRRTDPATAWIKSWKISKRELVEAVTLVGNSAERVRRYFEALRAIGARAPERVASVALRRSVPRSGTSRGLPLA